MVELDGIEPTTSGLQSPAIFYKKQQLTNSSKQMVNGYALKRVN
mgnify:CR=1 FL=1